MTRERERPSRMNRWIRAYREEQGMAARNKMLKRVNSVKSSGIRELDSRFPWPRQSDF